MSAYDVDEICELVGSFLLYALSLKYNKTNLSLYRDDILAVLTLMAQLVRKLKRNFKSFFCSTA